MHTAVMKMIIEKLNPRVVRKSYYKIFPIIHLEIICDLIHELKSLIRQSVVLQNFSEYSSVPWWICSSKKIVLGNDLPLMEKQISEKHCLHQ